MKIETTDYITVRQYAELKKITPQWVYKLICAGKVTSIDIAGIIFVKK